MSESKTKKASKTNAKQATKPTVQQLSFLPTIKQRPHYPDELKTATAPFVVVHETVTLADGSTVPLPTVWGRIDLIQNMPDPAVPGTRRDTPEEWSRRVQDYRTVGILQAVSVRPIPGGVWLEYGNHRVMGAVEMGWTYIRMDVDTKSTETLSAYKALKENSSRKNDQPLQLARHYKRLLATGLNQKQVAEVENTTQSTVSRRLRLVHDNMQAELAALVGPVLDENALGPLFEVLDDRDLALVGAQAILNAIQAKKTPTSPRDVLRLMAEGWEELNLAVRTDAPGFTYEVRQDPAFRKAAKSFEVFTVKVPDAMNPGRQYEVEFYRKADLAVKKAQEISDRLSAEEAEAERKAAEKDAKRRAKAGKGGKADPNAPAAGPKRRPIEDRLPERTRRIQVETMVRFLRAQVGFPEQLIVEALARFVDKCGVLHSKADQAAALAALGVVPESKQAEEMTGYGLSIEGFYAGLAPKKQDERGFDDSRSEDGFHALWKKDQAAALRCVALAMFFDANQGISHTLADEQGAKLLTGLSHEEAEVRARQSLKDQDAGFKPVVDGALCDHCDEAATLRRKNLNVCRSEFIDGITATTAAARRLARADAAKGATPVVPAAAPKAEPAKGRQSPAEAAPAEATPAGTPGSADAAPGEPDGAADGQADAAEPPAEASVAPREALVVRPKGRKAMAGA